MLQVPYSSVIFELQYIDTMLEKLSKTANLNTHCIVAEQYNRILQTIIL